MAYRRQGFDVASFISPFRGDPIGAQKLAADVWRGAAQDAGQNMALMAQERRARQQLEFEREAMGMRAATAQMMEGGRNARTRAALEQQERLKRAELQRKQMEAGAGLIGDAAKAQAAGDFNALAGIQARAQMLDPMMRMTLPGQAPAPRGEDGLPSVDEAYPLEKDALTVERGGQQLYGAGNAEVRQREMDVVGNMLSPLRSSPFAKDYEPSISAGVNAAGRGMTGADAGAAFLKQANAESDRLARMRNMDVMAGAQKHRMGHQDANLSLAVDKVIFEDMKDVRFQHGVDKAEKAVSDFRELERQFRDGTPLQQNIGFLSQIKTQVKGMNSDSDMRYIQRSAGFWNALEKDIDNVMKGGALPPGMIEQLVQAQQDAAKLLEIKKNKAGLAAVDRVYGHPSLPISDEEYVLHAHRAYQAITGRQLSPEDLQKELARFRARRAGLPAPPSKAGPPSSSFVESSSSFSVPVPADDNLGVIGGRPPRIPTEPAEYDVNAEADDLLGEED